MEVNQSTDTGAKKKFDVFVSDEKESADDNFSGPVIRPGRSSGVSIVGHFGTLDCSIGRIFRDEFGKNLKMSRTSPDPDLGLSLSVLIVDDSLIQRKLTQRALGGLIDEVMWMVEGVENGECALNLMESSPKAPDVIIVDQYMQTSGGQLLGHEVVEELRRNRAFDESVIIGCTGSIDEARPRFLEAGCDLVWSKPMPSKDKAQAEILRLVKERKSNIRKNHNSDSASGSRSGLSVDSALFNVGIGDSSSPANRTRRNSRSTPPTSPQLPVLKQRVVRDQQSYFLSRDNNSGSVFQFGSPPSFNKPSSEDKVVHVTEGMANIEVKE